MWIAGDQTTCWIAGNGNRSNAATWTAGVPNCPTATAIIAADWNADGFVSRDDYDAFASAFESGC